LALSVPDKGTGYSRYVLCTLKLISMFLLQLPIHLHIFHKNKKSLMMCANKLGIGEKIFKWWKQRIEAVSHDDLIIAQVKVLPISSIIMSHPYVCRLHVSDSSYVYFLSLSISKTCNN